MKILRTKAKNFGSYGNKWIEFDFTNADSGFYLLLGKNGSGKCVFSGTKIGISFKNKELEKEFNRFISK